MPSWQDKERESGGSRRQELTETCADDDDPEARLLAELAEREPIIGDADRPQRRRLGTQADLSGQAGEGPERQRCGSLARRRRPRGGRLEGLTRRPRGESLYDARRLVLVAAEAGERSSRYREGGSAARSFSCAAALSRALFLDLWCRRKRAFMAREAMASERCGAGKRRGARRSGSGAEPEPAERELLPAHPCSAQPPSLPLAPSSPALGARRGQDRRGGKGPRARDGARRRRKRRGWASLACLQSEAQTCAATRGAVERVGAEEGEGRPSPTAEGFTSLARSRCSRTTAQLAALHLSRTKLSSAWRVVARAKRPPRRARPRRRTDLSLLVLDQVVLVQPIAPLHQPRSNQPQPHATLARTAPAAVLAHPHRRRRRREGSHRSGSSVGSKTGRVGDREGRSWRQRSREGGGGRREGSSSA